MDFDALWRPGPPGLHLATLDAGARAEVDGAAQAGFRSPVVRVVRGAKARTVPALFDETAAALQFPEYFGESWDAFEEVINDLEWLPGDLYLIVVTRAGLLLSDAPDAELATLAEVLAGANRQWGEPSGRRAQTHHPTPFHVVLDDVVAGTVRLAERLSAVDAEVDSLA